jgi:hypothetical protein
MNLKRFGLVLLLLPCSISVAAQGQQTGTEDKKQQQMEMNRAVMSMSSKHMDMGAHMRMTDMRSVQLGDKERAYEIVKSVQQAIDKYKDYRAALRDGYQIFLPNVPQKMYHFNNDWYAMEANKRFRSDHPTSLLYEKIGDGYKLIGVMFTAPPDMTEEELNQRIPTSIAQWHQHVNLCLPPREQMQGLFDATSRFGVNGSISTKEECDKAGGRFFPRLFGWMVHLYPYEQKAEDMWSVERQVTPGPHRHMH